ncbi:DNA gyrase inhibitor YacG [Legionella sp. W05-934-2]|jgi:endogenous inhibitor of DNA gyrase (YacG/DUF329 family)|uniref:DNA gyrase inhibitor YacG n=1 Tax=Legionella sp. W05-934-2 TaxID=1198649 RepID=UPI0034633618
MQKLSTVTCPTCGQQDTWNPNNVARPFCSQRCKLIDLGEWASETRTIAGESIDPTIAFDTNDVVLE